MRVLLVEDGDVSRIALEQMLTRRGHEVTPCISAEEALAEYTARHYPLILVDLGLPGLDGFEFCRRVRLFPRYHSTVIIAITGRDTIEDVRRVMEAGADDYIVKPVPASILDVRLAIAEWHFRRHTELSRQRDEICLLRTLTALHDAPDLAAMLEQALKLGHEVGWTAGHAWVPLPDESALERCCGWRAGGEVASPPLGTPLSLVDGPEAPLPVRAWHAGALVCSTHGQALAESERCDEPALRLAEAVCVPVVAGSRIVAVLEFLAGGRPMGGECQVAILKALALGLGALVEKRLALDENHRLHRLQEVVLQSVVEGVAGLDHEGRATFVNPGLERLLGWSAEELLGHDAHDRLQARDAQGRPLDATRGPIQEAVLSGRESRGEAVLRHKEGHLVRVEFTCLSVKDLELDLACVVTLRPASWDGRVMGAGIQGG